MTELKPCRACGAPCRVETFKSETISASLWICSDASVFGGKCPETDGYISEEAWNTRAAPRPAGEVGALVELLNALTAHPEAVVRHTAINAAARITALSAEVAEYKRWHETYFPMMQKQDAELRMEKAALSAEVERWRSCVHALNTMQRSRGLFSKDGIGPHWTGAAMQP